MNMYEYFRIAEESALRQMEQREGLLKEAGDALKAAQAQAAQAQGQAMAMAHAAQAAQEQAQEKARERAQAAAPHGADAQPSAEAGRQMEGMRESIKKYNSVRREERERRMLEQKRAYENAGGPISLQDQPAGNARANMDAFMEKYAEMLKSQQPVRGRAEEAPDAGMRLARVVSSEEQAKDLGSIMPGAEKAPVQEQAQLIITDSSGLPLTYPVPEQEAAREYLMREGKQWVQGAGEDTKDRDSRSVPGTYYMAYEVFDAMGNRGVQLEYGGSYDCEFTKGGELLYATIDTEGSQVELSAQPGGRTNEQFWETRETERLSDGMELERTISGESWTE